MGVADDYIPSKEALYELQGIGILRKAYLAGFDEAAKCMPQDVNEIYTDDPNARYNNRVFNSVVADTKFQPRRNAQQAGMTGVKMGQIQWLLFWCSIVYHPILVVWVISMFRDDKELK